MSSEEVENLAQRMGRDRFEKRRHLQGLLREESTHPGSGFFIMERFFPLDRCLEAVLKFTGLRALGLRNYLDVQIIVNEVRSPRIPAAFDGFRLLQVSDLHCDLDLRLTNVVVEKLQSLNFDFAVLTGDYHNKIGKCHRQSLDEMEKILPPIAGRSCAILGNHDFLEKVPVFEKNGMTVLLNENQILKRGNESIAICGVDDPQLFRNDDLDAAKKGVGEEMFSVLLAHSPKPYEKAAALGYDLMLCGHTHGGQICLPGGFPLIRNTRCPLYMVAGAWDYKGMQGYTSRGTGACGVAARFFCPPEMTLHILRRDTSA
ncbi:MAG: metallophosphoesterase [Chthoniobacterales bacterium]